MCAGFCGSVGAVCARCALGVRSLFVRPCRYCAFVCHVGTRSWSARRCGSVVAFCPRFTPVFFPLSGKKRRLAMPCVSIPRGSGSPFVRSRGVGAVIGFGWFTSGLCVSLWRSRRVTGDAGLRGNGAGGAAFVHLCAVTLVLKVFPRGVRWGCAPQTAPKSLRLSGLSSGAGRVRECVSRGRALLVRIRGDCVSLCNHISLASLSAGSTLGLRAPDCAKEPLALWTLFFMIRGKVPLAKPRNNRYPRIIAPMLRSTQVHGETRPALIYGRAGRAVLRCYQLAQSETCLTLTYGQAGRVALRGSKCQSALPTVERMCMNSSPVMVSFSLRNLASACSSVMCALKSVQACS